MDDPSARPRSRLLRPHWKVCAPTARRAPSRRGPAVRLFGHVCDHLRPGVHSRTPGDGAGRRNRGCQAPAQPELRPLTAETRRWRGPPEGWQGARWRFYPATRLHRRLPPAAGALSIAYVSPPAACEHPRRVCWRRRSRARRHPHATTQPAAPPAPHLPPLRPPDLCWPPVRKLTAKEAHWPRWLVVPPLPMARPRRGLTFSPRRPFFPHPL